jgi:DNA-binding CsgD family transcriptional regulator/tetratricopeptide (TPR) repeat protein
MHPSPPQPTPPGLIERETALDLLNATLQACRAGAGRTVLVAGEAGIGKTALLRRWAEQAKAQGGVEVFWGGCEALFTPRPLGPVLEIAQALSPSITSLVQQQSAPSTLFAAFGSWLAVPAASLSSKQHQARVNVLIFEDVHWADHLTLDFLKYLGRRIHQWPAMLVLSYRDEEAGTLHPLTQVLGDLPAANTDKLALRPLSLEALATLSGYATDRTRDLLAVTGGNPFFVTEVLATAHKASPQTTPTADPGEAAPPGVPTTVSMAVMARAQRVSREARAVLEAASLVPGSVDPAHLTAVVGETATAGVDECVQAGLLQWDHHHLAFRHELARRAVEAGLSPLRRREMHARLYVQLRQQSQVLVDRAAYHAQHADDSVAVLATAPVAAARAAAMGAHREAAAHYRVALEHAQHVSDGERADLLERWAYEVGLVSSGREEAIAARHEALALRSRLGQTEQVGLNQRGLSSLYRARGDIEQAQRWLDAAITTLESIDPSAGLAMAYSMRSAAHMVVNEWRLAQSWGERAITLAQQFGEHGTIAHALNNIGSALADDGQPLGFELLQQSLDLALKHGMHDHASRAYRNASEACVRSRRLEQADALLVPGMEFARANDMDLHVWGLLGALVQVRLMQGRLDAAHTLAQEALSAEPATAQNSTTHLTVITVAATVELLRSPNADASALHLLWPDALASHEPDRIVPLALALAEAAWLRGEHQACAAVVQAARQACADLTPWDWSELALWAHRAGLDPKALSRAPLMVPCALELQGDLVGAASAWAERGMPRHQAYALMLMDPRQHPQALSEAIGLFDRAGALACADHARRSARKWAQDGIKGIKTGPRGAARTNRFGLTQRELQVAQQVATGLSNQEIAHALSRSPRTVENHVATAMAKLGAKRRGDVAALLAQ